MTPEPQHDDKGKGKARKSETEQSRGYNTGSVSSLRSPVLLCREGIPQILEDLYKTMDVGTIHEAAWVVIHVLMLETGYISTSEVINILQIKAKASIKKPFFFSSLIMQRQPLKGLFPPFKSFWNT